MHTSTFTSSSKDVNGNDKQKYTKKLHICFHTKYKDNMMSRLILSNVIY